MSRSAPSGQTFKSGKFAKDFFLAENTSAKAIMQKTESALRITHNQDQRGAEHTLKTDTTRCQMNPMQMLHFGSFGRMHSVSARHMWRPADCDCFFSI